MTPKEAIKKIQARIDTDFLNGEPFPGELEMAIEFLEKADKYRWHDLRKNPKDLPKFAPEEYSRDYLCEFKTHYGEIFHEICSYQYFDSVEDFDWCGMGWRERESLIAWKEIEPFEVEE